MSLVYKKLIGAFIIFALVPIPVWASSCTATRSTDIPFEHDETRLNRASIKILDAYVISVSPLDINITVICPVKSYREQNTVSDINAKRVDAVKKFLVTKGIPENKISTYLECEVINFAENNNMILVETFGNNRRCLETLLDNPP